MADQRDDHRLRERAVDQDLHLLRVAGAGRHDLGDLFKTNIGIQVRAVMQNPQMAASFGINSSRVYGLTFAYGAGLAGISGSMFAGLKTIFPDMGLGYVVEAFLVVVTGGGELFGSLATPASWVRCSRSSRTSPTTHSPASCCSS